MRQLIGLALLIPLGGCTDPFSTIEAAFGVATGNVPASSVYVAANSFDVAQSSAKVYISLPLCTTGGPVACRTQAATLAVDKAVRSGRSLRNQLEAYVNANPGATVPVSNYNALLATITTIQTYIGGSK
jgi:hypothetical protein